MSKLNYASVLFAVILLMSSVIAKIPNPYEVLGISRNADMQKIKEAFKKKSKQYHPDRNSINPQAQDIFSKVVNAYQLLKDPQRRRMYDLLGDQDAQAYQQRQNAGFQFNAGFGFPGAGINLEDLFKNGFFGNQAGQGFAGQGFGFPNQGFNFQGAGQGFGFPNQGFHFPGGGQGFGFPNQGFHFPGAGQGFPNGQQDRFHFSAGQGFGFSSEHSQKKQKVYQTQKTAQSAQAERSEQKRQRQRQSENVGRSDFSQHKPRFEQRQKNTKETIQRFNQKPAGQKGFAEGLNINMQDLLKSGFFKPTFVETQSDWQGDVGVHPRAHLHASTLFNHVGSQL